MYDHLIRCRKKHLTNISANKKQETSLTLMRKDWMLYPKHQEEGKNVHSLFLFNIVLEILFSAIGSNKNMYIHACVCVLATQSCPALCHPMDWRPPGTWSPRSWDSPGKSTGGVCHAMPRSSQPRDRSWVSMSPALAGGSLSPVPPREAHLWLGARQFIFRHDRQRIMPKLVCVWMANGWKLGQDVTDCGG